VRGFSFKPLDFVIAAVLLAAGLAGLWYNLGRGGMPEQKYAVVYVDNKPVAELSLAESDRYAYTIHFGAERQHEATLEIEGGRVRMLPLDESLCPRGICSHTGWISHHYESIVCLPNRIMVVFAQSPADPDRIDVVTY